MSGGVVVPAPIPAANVQRGCECECSVCHQPCYPLAPAAPVPASAPKYADPEPLFRAMLADRPQLTRLADECLAYAATHGIALLKHPSPAQLEAAAATAPTVTPDGGPAVMQAPVTLLPSRLPQRLYDQVRALVPRFNILYERISRDRAWLTQTLGEAVRDDPFVSRLLAIMNHVAETPSPHYKPQSIHLSINRSDYMLQQDAPDEPALAGAATTPGRFGARSRLLQVEFNTISVGAGSLCNKVSDLHRYLLDRFVPDPEADPEHGVRLNLPDNPVVSNLAAAMAQAHRLFVAQQKTHIVAERATPLVLFLVQPREANVPDQRHIEYALWREHRVGVRRATLLEVAQLGSIDPQTGLLWLSNAAGTGRDLVSVVYYRSCYTPRDFPTPECAEWGALEMLERSVAIKAPSLHYHLAGSKKVQQVLALPGQVERFIPSPVIAQQIRAVFAGLWSVNADSAARALAAPAKFVLKPQREGGGNNLFAEEMAATLRDHTPEQLRDYIIQERIGGPNGGGGGSGGSTGNGSGNDVFPTAVLRWGQLVVVPESESEIGMMGAMITGVEEEEDAAADSSSHSASVIATAATGDPVPQTQPQQPQPPLQSPSAASKIVVYHDAFVGYLVRTKSVSANEGGLLAGGGAVGSLVLVP